MIEIDAKDNLGKDVKVSLEDKDALTILALRDISSLLNELRFKK